jgi:hypothetical protein
LGHDQREAVGINWQASTVLGETVNLGLRALWRQAHLQGLQWGPWAGGFETEFPSS